MFLSEFNFRIMYQTNFKNVKVDVLTRISDFISEDVTDEKSRFQHQIILTSNRLKMHAIETEKNFIDQKVVEKIFQIIDILTSTSAKESSTINVSNRNVTNVVVVADTFSLNLNIIYNRVLTTNKKNTSVSNIEKL